MMYNIGAGGFGHGIGTFGCGFGMPMMGFGFVIFVIAIVATVYFIKKSKNNSSVSSEMELLNTRFIKGEITEEEYSRMKSVLKSK